MDSCRATTKEGKPCGATPRPGREWCAWHDPDLAARRDEWNRAGGQGKSNVNRARKRLPSDLQDVAGIILKALRDVEAGDLAPAQASAMSGLARAYCAVYESGLVDQRIKDLEALIAERTGT